MTETHRIEAFNTHLMTDAAIRAVATGRESEVAEIVAAAKRAAASPAQPMPALIVYGERGSGKSFLMRLVEMELAGLSNVACVLMPEEQYNIRASAQIPRAVAARIRGEDWTALGWRYDGRDPRIAWDDAVAELHAALDARFGPGQGIAVVLLENFDTLAEKLYGGRKAKSSSSRATRQSPDQRQAEERLRKLMGAPGGRFLLVASATGTVDMDYDRPLFQAFKPVELQAWDPDTAMAYFNRRRALDGAPPLDIAEEARARAIVEFIGGNPRLAQLLSAVLASPSARTVADTLDQLVDRLADYYRQRLDSLPPAAAALLDALVRGGEPVSQTELARRMGVLQSQIADAFSFLTRGRIILGVADRGASQLYRVRDRLFVHFYRRRYGGSHGLAPIAELLERFFTATEREAQIRSHLERGEIDDARAFVGSLPEGEAALRERFVAAGSVWAARYTIEGRAGVYAGMVKDLQRIEELAAGWPQAHLLARALAPITDGLLLAHCDDPGLLRDFSALLTQRYGDLARQPTARLHDFAAFLEAPDPEAHLRRIDPDVATAIRRIRNLAPPPPERSSKARKRKAGARRRGTGR